MRCSQTQTTRKDCSRFIGIRIKSAQWMAELTRKDVRQRVESAKSGWAAAASATEWCKTFSSGRPCQVTATGPLRDAVALREKARCCLFIADDLNGADKGTFPSVLSAPSTIAFGYRHAALCVGVIISAAAAARRIRRQTAAAVAGFPAAADTIRAAAARAARL